MEDQIRLIIDGDEYWFARSMVARHALNDLSIRLGRKLDGLWFRRESNGTWLGEASVLGDVLRDGEELELVFGPRSPVA